MKEIIDAVAIWREQIGDINRTFWKWDGSDYFSTTTAQAAAHSGGNSNKGGDLIYRVGNPASYQKGDASDQILFFQHGASWAIDFLPYCDQFVSTNNPEQYHVEVYPNPANDMIHLTWDSGKIITIKIFDLLGRCIGTETGNGGMAFLDVSALEAGMYLLQLEDIGVVKVILD